MYLPYRCEGVQKRFVFSRLLAGVQDFTLILIGKVENTRINWVVFELSSKP